MLSKKKQAHYMRNYRESGRPVYVVLKDKKAIEALDHLIMRHGSQRAAIEAALLLLEKQAQGELMEYRNRQLEKSTGARF